jgi:hypothetical protein
VERVLGQTFCLDGRTFDPITKPTAGGEWRTLHGGFDVADIADMVLDPAQAAGIRPRWRTRVLTLDYDAHQPAPSPWWDPAGPGASPALQRLLHEAEKAGCRCPIYRTPSGGWHVWIVLPEPQPVAIAHAIGRLLVAAAGMELAPSRCELFPNMAAWDEATDPKQRKAQNGVRLPGQAGGALWTGSGWATDPELAWREAAAALDATDAAAPGWEALQQAAAAELRCPRRTKRPADAPRCRSAAVIAWTAPGQSNNNLKQLANTRWEPGIGIDALALRMIDAARAAPGFARFASHDTKRRLASWCRDWAAARIRRRTPAAKRPTSGDPGRNARLHREAVVRVIDAAPRLARELGAAALDLSERAASDAIGLARGTFRKLKSLWLSRLTAALFPVPAARGSDPMPKGGGLDLLAVSEDPLISSSGPGDALSRSQPPPPHPPPEVPPVALPTKAPPRLDQRRQREREELARWLGMAAA